MIGTSSSPLVGGGLRNLVIDGSSNVTSDTLLVTSAQWCVSSDLYVIGNPGASAMVVNSATGQNSMHNRWDRVVFQPGTTNNSQALLYNGNGVDTSSNSCYDHWEDVTIAWTGAGSGVTIYGLRFRECDNVRMRDLHFYHVSGTGTNTPVVFDYTGVSAAWPADTMLDTVDLSVYTPINVGTPSGATANRIVAISATNGRPSNPALSNLDWGYSNASP